MGELGGGRKVVLVVWLLKSKESEKSVGAVCVRESSIVRRGPSVGASVE